MCLEKLDLLYDHYKETNTLSKQAQGHRNALFVSICVLEALSFWSIVKPDEAMEAIAAGINARLSTSLLFGNAVLQTLLWIIITYVTVRYCQETLYVKRQYPYIAQLEKEISKEICSNVFEREGEGYLKDYPVVLNIVDLFYNFLCPLLFIGINIARYVKECEYSTWSLAFVCDTILCGTVVIVTWFYFFEIHSKITTWCKNRIPFVKLISQIIHSILKEV